MFEEIMIKNFPELKVDLSPHIWEAQQILSRLSKKKYSRLIQMKSQLKDKEEILETIKEK